MGKISKVAEFGKIRYTNYRRQPEDKEKKIRCKWENCDTILNGYTIGNKMKFCGLHRAKANVIDESIKEINRNKKQRTVLKEKLTRYNYIYCNNLYEELLDNKIT